MADKYSAESIAKRLAKLDALNREINGPRASAPATKGFLGLFTPKKK